MAAWHGSLKADIGLRVLGLTLWWTAYCAVGALIGLHISASTANISALALADAGFVATSAGSALVFVGAHLFDRIAVSARWHDQFSEVELIDSFAGRQGSQDGARSLA